jgi:hypothetical protein
LSRLTLLPFPGGLTSATKGPTSHLNHRPKQKGKKQVKAVWDSWQNSASPGHFADGGFQAQTPPTFLGSDREAEYVAEIQQLWTMLAKSEHCQLVFDAAARVCGTKNKIALRLNVLDLTTVVFMARTMTTTAQNAA